MTTAPSPNAPEEPPAFRVLARRCPSRPVFEDITGRWSALTLLVLGDDPMRFSQIRRAVDGINEKALSQSLRALERDGFVERHASEGYPSRVEYNLTGLGVETAAHLRALVDHLEHHMPAVLVAQDEYDRRVSYS